LPGRLLVSALFKLSALLDAGGFAAQLAQVVELRALYLAEARHFDLVDARAVDWENPFHTHPAGNLADDEVLAEPAVLAAYDYSLEDLYALAVALFYLDVDFHRVARAELRQLILFTKTLFNQSYTWIDHC